MKALFSTQEITSKSRFDFWHEVVCQTYAHCVGSVSPGSRFSAQTAVKDFGNFEISEVESTPIRYERRKYDLQSGPRDDIFVSLMIGGSAQFSQGGRELVHNCGDVLIYDAGRPYSYNHRLDYRSILLRVPRPAIESRVMNVDDLGGTLLSSNSTYGRLIGSLIRQTYDVASSENGAQTAAFSSPTLDMIAAAIRCAGGEQLLDNSAHSALLQRIQKFMKQNIADETMTLETISRNQNVSVRTLSRLFSEAGTTPIAWLHGQRLAWAHSQLLEKKVGSVTEAAFASGFSDLSHFSRSFKKAYGCTPNAILTGH